MGKIKNQKAIWKFSSGESINQDITITSISYHITPDNSLYFYDKYGDGFGAEIFLPYDKEEDDDNDRITVCCGFNDDTTYVRDDFTSYQIFEAKNWIEEKREERRKEKT